MALKAFVSILAFFSISALAGASFSNTDLLSFQLGPMVGLQGGGSSVSFLGRYVPEYRFGSESDLSPWGVGSDLALSSFNYVGESNFLLIEYGVYGAYHYLDRWEGRLLMGGQTWTAGNGTAFFMGVEGLYHFKIEENFLLDSVFVSYAPVFFSENTAHELGIGLQFKL